PGHGGSTCASFREGLHSPFVHPALQASVASYRVETFAGGSVQIARARADEPAAPIPLAQAASGGRVRLSGARADEPALALAREHALSGERLAALYFWIFPATMLNVYPWGMSL